MGYFGKLKEKAKVIELRKTGLSYSQIQKIVHVSKSTLSVWCRDIQLNKLQKENLENIRKKSARAGSHIAARNKIAKRNTKSKEIHSLAIQELGEINKRERFVAGIALYLGDGYKTDKRFGFSNADPRIIKLMMSWLLEFTNIEKRKIHGRIWLHDDLDEKVAKSFWSKLLDIKESNFIKSYVVKNKPNSKKIRKNIHNYGVFSLIVNNKDLQEKMIGFMTGILSK